MKTFKEHLQQLHLYFRNSAKRSAVLSSAAAMLGITDLKVKVRNVNDLLSSLFAYYSLYQLLDQLNCSLFHCQGGEGRQMALTAPSHPEPAEEH